MNELLADIKAKLHSGDYRNEEHVRLSLVARVLQHLGWDIWNPKEVNTEFIAAPNEDKTRVDVALFLTPHAPAVFIEVKGVGQIQRLQDIERQLRGYNRDNTAMFAIITDGREWRFYLSQTGGEFSKKCFKTFDFQEDDLKDIEASLSTFLSKSEIKNGNAKLKADTYLQLNQKQQAAEDCLPEARRRISEPPYPSLPEALVSLVSEKEFSITQAEAINFIREAAERRPVITVSEPPIQSPISEPEAENSQSGRQKKSGKMAFVYEHLLATGDARMTKSAISAAYMKAFPGTSEKTARQTVHWAASRGLKKMGKVSNHLPNPR